MHELGAEARRPEGARGRRARPTHLPFEHRSGRLVSVCRATVAGLFMLATAVDPGASTAFGRGLPVLLVAYALVAAGLLLATWNDWWLDFRLGLAAHAIDLAFFTILIAITGGYSSPFFGFFIYLVIAAAIRWRTRQALATTLWVVLLFLVSAWAGEAFGPQGGLDLLRFITRGASLFILSVMIIWFALNQHGAIRERIGARSLESVVSPEPPAADALLFAADRLGAGRALLAWGDLDEPWLNLLWIRGGRVEEERVAPDVYPDLIESLPVREPFLFAGRGRKLLFESEGKLRMMKAVDLFPAELASRYGLDGGVAIPLRTSKHEGILVALDIPGISADHLSVADSVGEQIAGAFERAALLGSIEEATAAEARLALARDLHDGAVQFFAGLALKIRSLKGKEGDSALVAREMEEIEAELVQQQRDVRSMIDQLRQPALGTVRGELGMHLEALAKRMSSQWRLAVMVERDGDPVEVTSALRGQIDRIVREAVSNAVRHGAARRVALAFAREGAWLRLGIRDDGGGFAFEGARSDEQLWQDRLGPRSLHERVRAMGGFLSVSSGAAGSAIDLRLPLEEGKT
jgi:signal transduction histidine kinase